MAISTSLADGAGLRQRGLAARRKTNANQSCKALKEKEICQRCPGGKYLKLGLIFPDTLSFTRQAITMDRYGQARLLVGRLGRFGPYDRAPAYDIGRNSPNDLCRKQDAHLEDGSGLNTLLRAEQNARPADVHGCSFVPVGLAALTIAKGCVNWESLGTWFVLTPFLTRIARQFITLV